MVNKMANLTEKYIAHLHELRESKAEVTGDDQVAQSIILAKMLKKEKGLGDYAMAVAALIVDKGMSYEEALKAAQEDELT